MATTVVPSDHKWAVMMVAQWAVWLVVHLAEQMVPRSAVQWVGLMAGLMVVLWVGK